MTNKKRVRRAFSFKAELITKSREAALAAVQVFNNPLITFKSEMFVVLMNIAWTYLLHAYYRGKDIEYRYFRLASKRRVFERTKAGAYKYWELERCLNDKDSPIDKDTANNLRFLIGIRHEIEHQMTFRIDNAFSAKFQACCLNYNDYVKTLFGVEHGIDRHLSFSLQFSSISRDQADTLPAPEKMRSHIQGFVEGFEGHLSNDEFNSPKFAYRVLFVAKTANRKGQADQVIEFVKADSTLAQDVNKAYTIIKETERPKHLPKGVVAIMRKEGFTRFSIKSHTDLWKGMEAKADGKGYGVYVEGAWYWYDNWVEVVRKYCQEHTADYR